LEIGHNHTSNPLNPRALHLLQVTEAFCFSVVVNAVEEEKPEVVDGVVVELACSSKDVREEEEEDDDDDDDEVDELDCTLRWDLS
jgi:hypothetical protein